MMFTSLETACVSSLLALLVGVAVYVITRNVYVSQGQCRERRGVICDEICEIKRTHVDANEDIKARTIVLFRMIRALIAHSDELPPAVKAQILNETTGGDI
jgi:hypothetical protein